MKKFIIPLFIIIMFVVVSCGVVNTSTQLSQNPIVTKDEFNQITNGMPYDQVIKIIGGEGEKVAETGKLGDKYYIVTYQYNGKGDSGANANFTFENGKVICKAQAKLK